MSISNEITLDHVRDFFDLSATLKPLNITPTATGGAGIDNESQFPPIELSVNRSRSSGTQYVQKYKQKENESQFFRDSMGVSAFSTLSLNTYEDVDGASTAADNVPDMDEFYSENTQNIYETYFKIPNRSYNEDLTITKYRDEILQQMNINPVVIVQGPTGCGKTTQVPQYILDYYQSRGTHCNIIVTQPRKIAAISIARRVCHERKWQLGTIVGYQVAMDAKTSTDTRLCYVTTGVLLEKLVNAKRMDMYTHVIIDEVHERNQDIDFALILVKKFLATNSQRVKVILMSATFDSSKFSDYFSSSSRGNAAPVIDIIGKSKEVTEHYVAEIKTLFNKEPTYDFGNPRIDENLYPGVLKLMSAFDEIEKLEQGAREAKFAPKRGAVLIFLPGYDEIARMSDQLRTESFNRNYWIIPLHSSITVEEQTKVFRDAPSDHRKVILSTNIAESSITVPDVKYVIDFCLTKCLVTDPATNYTCLQVEWASKSNCIQRKGRAGRVDIGKVYRMVPRYFYDELPDYGVPEIKRCPLSNTLLHIKKLNLCEPQEMFAFALDPPNLEDIEHSILQLKEALALTGKANDPYDGDLTFVGRVMANLPLDIKLSKLIIFGFVFHCLKECIVIAASLSLQSFFAKPFRKILNAYRSRLSWADGTFSDCLSHLNAYSMWERLSTQGQFNRPGTFKGEMEWADKNFIQLKRIKEVDLLVKDITKRLERLQISVDDRNREVNKEANILIIKIVIAGAFFPFYFVQDELNETEVNREINGNDPLSTVMVTKVPEYGILYASAIKDMLSCCSDKMNIEFEGNKAYIKFESINRNPNSVILPVYLAVKMRLIDEKLQLSVFSHEEAERKYKQMRHMLESQQDGSKNQLASNRLTMKFGPDERIQRVALPGLNKMTENIFITHVENCGNFWARYTSPSINNYFYFLETTIATAQNQGNLKPLKSPPQLKQLYLAPYYEGPHIQQPMYYRAQVMDLKGDRARVFFVDYGNVEIVKINELRDIDESTPDVRNTPALAIKCQLAEVKPSSIKSHSEDWSEAANTWFKKHVSGLILTAKIYSVINDTIRLELLKKKSDAQIMNINSELKKLGYAVPSEESKQSKSNNEMRTHSYDYNTEVVEGYQCNRDQELYWKETANCRTTHSTVYLKGPFNPLEATYCGLTSIDLSRRIKIEADSVNSVSFNSEPQDTNRRMLVAAHIGVGHQGHDLIARNTTLMPKLRGLPSILCLLFAPFAEFRANKSLTAYTGALCGLGYDSKGHALYQDHDIEISFDVNITKEDVDDINTIRMGFNRLLQTNETNPDVLMYPANTVAILHENTRTKILKLLEATREPKEPEYFMKQFMWDQFQGKLEKPRFDDGDCQFVFPLHRPPLLIGARKAERQAMKGHLDELYNMAHYGDQRNFKGIQCKLCSVNLSSHRELLIHMDSDKHNSKEEKFRQGVE